MSDPTTEEHDGDPPEARRRWDRGVVWIGLVAVVVAGALVVAWLAERRTGDTSAAPRDGAAYCNTVGELHRGGDITLAIGEGSDGLQRVADGLVRLQDAGPPTQIRDDLGEVRSALLPVIAATSSADPQDPAAMSRLLRMLDDEARKVQPAADRVNAYTERWCGVDLNGTDEPDEGPAPAVTDPAAVPPAAAAPGATVG